MYEKHYISDQELQKFQKKPYRFDNNLRSRLLYQEQRNNFPQLSKNLKQLKNQKKTDFEIDNILIRLVLNITRKTSVKANTFKSGNSQNKCKLCHLLPGQKGFPVLNQQYFVIPNPGITISGDLTIPAIEHRNQEITGNFVDMLKLSKELYDYSIYFNGAMAGATCPHLHFQAGRQNILPGEKQILSIFKNNQISLNLEEINKVKNVRIYRINDFYRECFLLIGQNMRAIQYIFNGLMDKLRHINSLFESTQNIPHFGQYISALDKKEEEARINIMVNWDKDIHSYTVAIFPKRTNRPKIYYNPENKIILGMAIKEALGNIITFRIEDYNRLKNSPSKIIRAFQETSVTKQQGDKLTDYLVNM
ncbi:MAG TPA: DUF4922 domain-containing protein [bacterium]|nr:DUF4922 domain-containing protein [bacterium]